MALIQFDRGSGLAPAPVLPTNGKEGEEKVTYGSGNVMADLGVAPVKITGTRDIALPDPKVSSFSVSGGKVRQRIPRNEREDDGLDV